MAAGSAPNTNNDILNRTWLDPYGFIINPSQPQPPPPTKQQLDKEACNVDKWMCMIARWPQTVKDHTKLRRRVRRGVPDSLRGLAWQLLIGSRSMQMKHPGLYEDLLQREMDAELREIVNRDLSRTFPTHTLFLLNESMGAKSLFRVLQAFAVYDPCIGYCQGMGFIAATLLTQMDEESSFWSFVVLMKSRRYSMGELYMPGFPLVQKFFAVMRTLLQRYLPNLATHLQDEGVDVSYFTSQWFMTLFVYQLPFDLLLPVWDLFLIDRWKIIFRIALCLLASAEKDLLELKMEDILPRLRQLHVGMDKDTLIAEAFQFKVTNRELDLIMSEYDEEGA